MSPIGFQSGLPLSAIALVLLGIVIPTNGNSSSGPSQGAPVLEDVSPQMARQGFAVSTLNGGQFVQLLDPIMEGQLSRIVALITRKYPESFNLLATASKLPARQFLRILDNLSEGEVSEAMYASFPTLFTNGGRLRRSSLDTMSGLSLGNSKKSSLDPMSGVSFGAPSKRFGAQNFDEMDRAGFSGFAKRRSEFDELDRSGFSGFAKRRSEFDELDHSGFSGFAKRRSEFDELDRSGFSGFAKRGRGEFDELDHSGFSGFAKRGFNFDELDRISGFTGFNKRARMNPLVNIAKAKQQQGAKSQVGEAAPVKQQTNKA